MSSKGFFSATDLVSELGIDFNSISGEVADIVLLVRTDLPVGCSTENPDADTDSDSNLDYTALLLVFSIRCSRSLFLL